jgi:hypothetical protein
MDINDLSLTRKTIKDAIPSSNPGGKGLDVSYSVEAMSPKNIARLRKLGEDGTYEEEAVCELLEAFDMEWTLTAPRAATEDEIAAGMFKLDSKNVARATDADGNLIQVPVPSSGPGLRSVRLAALVLVAQAIQEDAHPKAGSDGS